MQERLIVFVIKLALLNRLLGADKITKSLSANVKMGLKMKMKRGELIYPTRVMWSA